MKRDRISALVLGAGLVLLACNRDDASVTAKAQGAVNLAIRSPDSDVQVVVRDGRATLTGIASSELVRVRAEKAAGSVEGVSTVDDQIALPTVLTGATVPRAR